jgi:hypothetical protein
VLRLSHGRSPPTDGKAAYHFPVTPSVTLHGKTLDELRTVIHEYRLRQNMPLGDVDTDIDAYYCGKWPTFCHDAKDGIGPSVREKSAAMMRRVSQWVAGLIHKMPRGGYELVTQKEADTRATICAECPQKGPWRSGCGGCDASTLTLLQQVKQLKRTSKDGNLASCSIGGWENSSAIWLPESCLPLSEAQKNTLPAPCWRKAL